MSGGVLAVMFSGSSIMIATSQGAGHAGMEEALLLIILAISISQGKCQEESEEDEAWMDLVMVGGVRLWHVEANL